MTRAAAPPAAASALLPAHKAPSPIHLAAPGPAAAARAAAAPSRASASARTGSAAPRRADQGRLLCAVALGASSLAGGRRRSRLRRLRQARQQARGDQELDPILEQCVINWKSPDLGTRCIGDADMSESDHWAPAHIGERWKGDWRSYKPEEVHALLQQLRQQLQRVPDLPKWRLRPAIEDDKLLWWFLRDRFLNVEAAAEKLESCLRWRQRFRVDYLGPEQFGRELKTRKAYMHRHCDITGRPVVVAIASRHSVFERKLEDSERLCAWFMERTMDRLVSAEPPPLEAASAAKADDEGGKDAAAAKATYEEEPRAPHAQAGHLSSAEQALGIIDLRGFSLEQADVQFAYFLIEVLHEYYPGRFGRVLLVDAPPVFVSFWEGIKPMLHRYATLCGFVHARDIRRYFAPGETPEEFL